MMFFIIFIFASVLAPLFLDTYSLFLIFMDSFSAGVSHGLLKKYFYSLSSWENIYYISQVKHPEKLCMSVVYLVPNGCHPILHFSFFLIKFKNICLIEDSFCYIIR